VKVLNKNTLKLGFCRNAAADCWKINSFFNWRRLSLCSGVQLPVRAILIEMLVICCHSNCNIKQQIKQSDLQLSSFNYS